MDDPFDERHLRRTAAHEASHAVAAAVLRIPFDEVTIQLSAPDGDLPEGFSLGKVHRSTEMCLLSGDIEKAKLQLIQMLAGPIGERLAEPGLPPDYNQDARDVERVLRFTFCSYELADGIATFNLNDIAAKRNAMDDLKEECKTLAYAFVTDNFEAISAVANLLLERGRLSEAEVIELSKN